MIRQQVQRHIGWLLDSQGRGGGAGGSMEFGVGRENPARDVATADAVAWVEAKLATLGPRERYGLDISYGVGGVEARSATAAAAVGRQRCTASGWARPGEAALRSIAGM